MPVRLITEVLALAMCAYAADGEPTNRELSGIQGVVMVSPSRPGPIKKGSESPNMAPLRNAKFKVTNDGHLIASLTTDLDGRFRVLLKPGHYSFSLAENRFPKPCGPFQVTVDPGRMTNVEWRCDSGMR